MDDFENKMPETQENDTAPQQANEQQEVNPLYYQNAQNTANNANIPSERFEYTPIEPQNKTKLGGGIRVFCIIVAILVAITGAGSVGYYYGKRTLASTEKTHTEIELAARPQTGEELTEAQVYEKVKDSIVGVRVYNTDDEVADCSGVVYSSDGYIVSNDHIYADIPDAKFKIYTSDGKEYDAEYVAGDQISDLTILKVKDAKLTPATFGDSDDLFCGEHVVAIGRPSDAKGMSSITSGVISMPSRRMLSTTSYSSNLIETDSAINPGSSGGALVNLYGQVIGITSSKLTGTLYDSVCFAIPSRTVKRVCEELIQHGKVVSRARLGISYTEFDSVAAEIAGSETTGIKIASVSQESDLYGKVEEGDIITHVNGEKITSDSIILDIIENSSAGDSITVTVEKKSGGTKEYTAKLLSNEGSSSYLTADEAKKLQEKEKEQSEEPNGSEFNFPFGD